MRVNVVCTDVGWIYTKFIAMYRKYSRHQILLNKPDVPHQVTHYLPYYEMPKNPKHPSTAWMSHQEARPDLYNKFVSVARSVDFAISHSRKYMELLKNAHGIKNIKQVIPGVDAYKFQLRPTERPPSDKLIVGYIGRQYSSSDRKNPKLLNDIGKLPFVELKVTGGNIKEENIPKFYSGLDLVVSPATIEGGPMATQEALACGVPIMCYEDVGVANEFELGVIKIKYGDSKAFIEELERFWDDSEEYLGWREQATMQAMRKQVEEFTWQRFVEEHDKVWESIV